MMQIPHTTADPRVVCNASPETGPCLAYFPSFFYNSTSGKCERFVYGGCQGNANRFGTEQQCNNKCGQSHVIARDV